MRNKGFFGKTFDLNRDGKFSTIERIMDIAMYDLMTNDTEDIYDAAAKQNESEKQKTLIEMSEIELKRVFENLGLDMEKLEDVSKSEIIEALEWDDITADDLGTIDKYTIIEALEKSDLYSEEDDDEDELVDEDEYTDESDNIYLNSVVNGNSDISERLRSLGFDPSELVRMGFEEFAKTMKAAGIHPIDISENQHNVRTVADDRDILVKLRNFGLDPAVLSCMNFEDFMDVLKAKEVRPEDLE